MTALGISNVSFGVGAAARGVLNSVFLYHAVKAGLDMAIVNPAHITPYFEIPDDQRQIAEDLIFNSDADALPRFIQYFEDKRGASRRRGNHRPHRRYDQRGSAALADRASQERGRRSAD